MDAQQLAGDDGEQSTGYRCSRTTAGVRKPTSVPARVGAARGGAVRRVLGGTERQGCCECSGASTGSYSTRPISALVRCGDGEQECRIVGEACECTNMRVLRVSCASVRTEELKAQASTRYHGRSWWPELLFVKGGYYNVWNGAGKTGEGAQRHRGFSGDDGLTGEAEEMPKALIVGDVRVHDEDEEGEEDIEEEADPEL
jgi:hypothetical protein